MRIYNIIGEGVVHCISRKAKTTLITQQTPSPPLSPLPQVALAGTVVGVALLSFGDLAATAANVGLDGIGAIAGECCSCACCCECLGGLLAC